MPTTYTVIYRQGGPKRYRWNRCLTAHKTLGAARKEMCELERQGYYTLIRGTEGLNETGLPLTYSNRYSVENVKHLTNGWMSDGDTEQAKMKHEKLLDMFELTEQPTDERVIYQVFDADDNLLVIGKVEEWNLDSVLDFHKANYGATKLIWWNHQFGEWEEL